MEFINMFDKFINERVAKAIEDQANLHERDANRIANLERKVLTLSGDFETRVGGLECQVDDVEERFGVDVQDYIKEYFNTARIKVTIDKEVI